MQSRRTAKRAETNDVRKLISVIFFSLYFYWSLSNWTHYKG